MIEYANNKYLRRHGHGPAALVPPVPGAHSDSAFGFHSTLGRGQSAGQRHKEREPGQAGAKWRTERLRGREAASYLIDHQRSCRFTYITLPPLQTTYHCDRATVTNSSVIEQTTSYSFTLENTH